MDAATTGQPWRGPQICDLQLPQSNGRARGIQSNYRFHACPRTSGNIDLGDITGWVETTSGGKVAFLRFPDATTTYFQYPGAFQTVATDINNLRQIVGYYRLSPNDDDEHAFLAVLVPEPSTLALLFAALPLAYLTYRRRRTVEIT